MEIKKATVMFKKVCNFLVWEYCYSGDQGNNGSSSQGRECSLRDDLQRNQLLLGKAQHTAVLPEALQG